MKSNHLWFLGFTAVFAVFAAWLFWGTWALDVVPVMPDCAWTHSSNWFTSAWRDILTSGKFVPDDLKKFVFGPYFWQELQYALALYLAALGLVYFCRGRGLSLLASYGAGLLLAFCGYWCTLFSAGHLGWFRWMTYGVFAFGLIDRALSKGKLKYWLLLGATVAWASFYQTDLWLIFTVFTGVYFVWGCVRERKFPWKGALFSAAVFFAIGAPAIRSAFVNDLAGRDQQINEGQTIAKGGELDEAEKRWIFATNWSLPPSEVAEFFIPRVNGDTSCPFTLSIGLKERNGVTPYTGALGRPKDAAQGNYRQHSLYVGWVTCLLALLGAFWGRRKCLFFTIAAIVFCAFSFGRYCEVVYRCVFALPFGDYLRAPVKWHHLTEFCLCVLAGFGLEALIQLTSRFGRAAMWIVGGVILIGVFDLTRVDRLYCAPVPVGAAQRTNSTMQLTILNRQQFQTPQVSEMARRGRIVSIANYLGNPDYFLVGVLEPCKPPKPLKSDDLNGCILALLSLSLLTTLGVSVFCVYSALTTSELH